jgi:hypothetical protein
MTSGRGDFQGAFDRLLTFDVGKIQFVVPRSAE